MAYVTLSELRAWIGASSTVSDAILQDCISAAQRYIEMATGRVFECTTATTGYLDAKYDVSDGNMTLWLRRDVSAITAVINGDGVAVSTSEYTTIPRNETPYYQLHLKPSSGKTWTYTTDYEDVIQVVAKWSYSTTAPDDVSHATMILAAQMFAQKDNPNDADKIVSADGVVIIPSSIPRITSDVIRKYRKLSFV